MTPIFSPRLSFSGALSASKRTHACRAQAGFTLLETSLATIIIGVGVLAIVEAQQAFLIKNSWSTNASTATYLASEIREMARSYARHDRFSGGVYLTTPGDPNSLTGWGPESDEGEPADYDDLDDLDGVVFGDATNFPDGFTLVHRFPGPINASGGVIPETLWDGSTETIDVEGVPSAVPMRGWTQIVEVEKVDPFDYSLAVADNLQDPTTGTDPLRAVDQYPLRVRVTVLFQTPFETEATPITSVTWIVPP